MTFIQAALAMRHWFHEKDLLVYPIPKVTIEIENPEIACRMMMALKAELDPLVHGGMSQIDFDQPVQITGMEFTFKFAAAARNAA